MNIEVDKSRQLFRISLVLWLSNTLNAIEFSRFGILYLRTQ